LNSSTLESVTMVVIMVTFIGSAAGVIRRACR
jgi:hypothetical protein